MLKASCTAGDSPDGASKSSVPKKKLSRPYQDPYFATREGKRGLAKRLWEANMVRFCRRRRGPTVRCFCVVKKLDSQGVPILRLIMDLRGTNDHFVDPPYTSLANGAGFGFVDLSSDILQGRRLTSFAGDIPDYFYRLEIIEGLSEFFCLAGITAQELARLVGVDPPPSTHKFVGLRIIPMGFNWAPWIAQICAEDIIAHVVKVYPLLRDYDFLQHGSVTPQFFCLESGRPLSQTNGNAYVYIDDFGGWLLVKNLKLPAFRKGDAARPIPISPEAKADCDRMCAEFRSRGLDVHKIQFGLPENLGYKVIEEKPSKKAGQYTYVLRGQDSKLEPLITKTAVVLRRNQVSAHQLSRIIGSWTWLCLLNRPLLSIFETCYQFVRENWIHKHENVPLWESVAGELQCLLGCLPFLQANMSQSWAETVYEVDAGPTTCAVIRSKSGKNNTISQADLRVIGSLAERGGWLINDAMTASPVAERIERRLVSLDEDGNFVSRRPSAPVEIPEKWFNPKLWKVAFTTPSIPGQHNTPSEVRCVALAVMHALKGIDDHWGKRLACFSDAGAATGCYSKGRSGSEQCNGYCRQVACCLFLSDIRLFLRWVSSAHNCADGPSRGMRRPGVALETVSKAEAARVKVWQEFADARDERVTEAFSAFDEAD